VKKISASETKVKSLDVNNSILQPPKKVALSNGYRTQSGRALHEAEPTEFIVKKDGSLDFGEIGKDIEIYTRGKVKSGKIRLQAGFNRDNGVGFGLKYIKKREKSLQKLGFNNVEDYVEYIAENFDRIYSEPKSDCIMLAKMGDKVHTMPVDLVLKK